MKIFHSAREMYAQSIKWQESGNTIALVPTMGCLHEGHLSLMRRAKSVCEKTIVSLFVNPKQFGPNEDLDSYPTQFKTDCNLAKDIGVDAIFCPEPGEMYPELFQTNISVKSLSKGMCGSDRPGHFDGVATVVTKLFNITAPNVAVFGRKDFQQLAIIRQLTEDLNFNVEIIGSPIIREKDGLAMSSRNRYLDTNGRKNALCLSQAIKIAKKMVVEQDGIKSEIIIDKTREIVEGAGGRLEYAVVVNEYTLIPDDVVNKNSVLALAAKIGKSVRLLDNSLLVGREE